MIIENILKKGCGSIEVYDNSDGDLATVNSARVSFAKRNKMIDLERDPRLITYLSGHNHFTPFTHKRFTFKADALFDPWKASPEDLAGCVFKIEGGIQKVRHSVWGWKNLLENGVINPIYYRRINEVLVSQLLFSWKWIKPQGPQSDDIEPCLDVFEHDPDFIDVTLVLDMPFYVARQWFKHQVGFSRNEVSRRYVSDAPTVFNPDAVRASPKDGAKQGSDTALVRNHRTIQWNMEWSNDLNINYYNECIADDVCPEQARGVLPMATMTQFFETGSLTAYRRLLKQRLDPHAQLEIRKYAEAVKEILGE